MGTKIPYHPSETSFASGDAIAHADQAAATAPAALTQLAAPAGGTGDAAGAYDTAGNRDLAIASINAARDDIIQLRTEVAAVVTLVNRLRTDLITKNIITGAA